MEQYDVLIVGGGPTGLSCALALTRNGVSCLVVDKKDGPVQTSNALAVQSRTLEIFHEMGIVDEIERRGQKLTHVDIHTQEKKVASFSMEGVVSPYPYVICLPQHDTEEVLSSAVGSNLLREAELLSFEEKEDGVLARVKKKDGSETEIRSRYIVGCDGAHSTIRKSLNIPFEGSTLEQNFVLADAKIDWEHTHDGVYPFLSPDGPMAIFCLPNGMSRIVAEVREKDHIKDLHHPTKEEFETIAKNRSSIPMNISQEGWASGFTINSRMVNRYREGRAFLCGDAAHIHSPVGGQGMNTGIQDAYNLAWKLSLVVKGKAPQELLNSYEEERKPVAKQLLAETHAMTNVVTAKSKMVQWIRNTILSFASKSHKIEQTIATKLAEQGISYKESSIVDGSGLVDHTHFDELDDTHHHLFIFSTNPKEAAAVEEAVRTHYGDLISIHVKPHEKHSGMYLVRPDQRVAFESTSLDFTPLQTFCSKIFTSP